MAETSNENKDLRKFYDYLQNGYKMQNLPDFTTFSGYMLNSENRERIYNKMKKGGVKDLPSFEDFSSQIGLPIPEIPMYGTDGNGKPSGMSVQDYNQKVASTLPPPEQKSEAAQQSAPTMVNAPQEEVQTGQQATNATSEQNAPRGQNLVMQPQGEGEQQPFTPYTERMAQQTAPYNEMMNAENTQQTANEEAAKWEQKRTDYDANTASFEQSRSQYDNASQEYEKARAEFGAKYPEGWQPKTRAEQMQYERDADVINAQANLLNAQADELNKSANSLNSQADELMSHYQEMSNASSLRAQTLEGNVSNLMDDVRNEIATAKKQRLDARGYNQPRGGYASMGASLNRSMGADAHDERTNDQTKYGIAERILGRIQNQMDEFKAEQADARLTGALENLGGEYFGWLGKAAGSINEYLEGYKRGTVDAIKDGAGFDFGIQDAAEMKYLYDAVKKSDAIDKAVAKQAKGEKLTPEESQLLKDGLSKADKAILDAASMEVVAASMYKTGWGYTGGEVGVQMIPFILEIAISPLAAAGKAAGNGVIRYALKKYGVKGFKGAIAKGISKINPVVVSKTAQIATDLTVGGMGQAVTTGAANTYADYVRRKMGDINYSLDEKGNVVYGGHEEGMGTGKALASAVTSQSLEYSTENYSEWVDGLGAGIADALTKGKASKLAKATQKAMKTYAQMHSKGFGKVMANIRKVGHIGGPFEEYTEELVNNIGNGIIDYIAEGKNNFHTEEGGVFNIGDNVETFLSVTMPQVFQGLLVGASHMGNRGLRYVQQYRYNSAYNDAIKNASKAFGVSSFNGEEVGVWDAVKSHIDNASQEDLAKEVTSLIMGDNFNADQKIAILNYAQALQAKRAEDLAETKLTEYKYDTDPDYQELSHRVNVTDNTIQPATTADGDAVYLKTSNLEAGTAIVYNPLTGEDTQVSSDFIVELGDILDPNEEADKIEQARDIAQALELNTTANINGSNYTIVDKTPETGMPIAQIENPDGTIETREMTNEEVMAMSQQMQMQADDAAENETLNPMQKIQKAIQNGDGELLNTGMEELANAINDAEDEATVNQLEAQIKALGEDFAKQFEPVFEQKRATFESASADAEAQQQAAAEEQKQKEEASTKRLGEIRALVDSILDIADLDEIDRTSNLSDNDQLIAKNIIEKKRRELKEQADAERTVLANSTYSQPYKVTKFEYGEDAYAEMAELEKQYKDRLLEISAMEDEGEKEEAAIALDKELPLGVETLFDNNGFVRIAPVEPAYYDEYSLHDTYRKFKVGDEIEIKDDRYNEGTNTSKVTAVDVDGKVMSAENILEGAKGEPTVVDGEIVNGENSSGEDKPLTQTERIANINKSGIISEQPTDAQEAAAWAVLSLGFKKRLNSENVKKELGEGAYKDLGNRKSWFVSRKSKLSVEGLAEEAHENLSANGLGEIYDVNDIRNYIIEFISSGSRESALEYLENKAGKNADDPYNDPEFAAYLEAQDKAEWEAYNEISQEILENELKDLSEEEINNIFAEILEQQINENEQANGESNIVHSGETEEQQQSGVIEGSAEVGEGEHIRDTEGNSGENELSGDNTSGEEGSVDGGNEGVSQVPPVEGGQTVKPTTDKPSKPKKPGNNSTREEAQAYFNSVYGEGSAKAKSAMRVWELTHKNKPAAKKADDGLMNKSEVVGSQDELTDEEKAELQMLGIQLGQDFVEGGDVKIADFFNTMVSNFGDGIRPFVKSIYMGISANVEDEIADEMDDRKTVRAFDINTPVREEEEDEVEQTNEENNEDSNVQESDGDTPSGDLAGGDSEGEVDGGGESGNDDSGSDNEAGDGAVVSGDDSGVQGTGSTGGSGVSTTGGSKGSGSVRSGGSGSRGSRGSKTNGGKRTGGGNKGSNESDKGSGSARELTDEEKAKQAEEKAYNEAKEAYAKETNIDVLKSIREGFKNGLKAITDFLQRANTQGKYRAVTERIKELLKEQPQANIDITQEKVPYVPVSDPEGLHAIGSVVPSGAMKYLNDAIIKLEEKEGKSVDEFVMEELGYDSLEDMYSDYANNKETGLASEQVDSVGLAIEAMKEKRCFIIGDMTGVGKGRQAASLIRWGKKHGKKVVFVTEKPDLFTAMYEDLKDIGTNNLVPFIVNDDANANITENIDGEFVEEEVVDDEGNVTIERTPKKRVVVRHPSKKISDELYKSESDELPAINGKGQKKYDFVMMTYSQTASKSASAQKKLEWLKNYAKDAIIIMDEAHNASGESNTGQFFQDVVQNCEGVTFLSATYAKRPENMMLYALRSSLSQINMAKEDLLNAISEYGIPMQEILAGALFQSGEMVRRERDFSDVETHWITPTDVYDEKEIDNFQKTSDMTSALLNEMIDFQRDTVGSIVDNLNASFEAQNAAARLVGNPIKEARYTPYSGQVSNIFGMMMYGMKSRKTAEMAIQQIKDGKKPVIAVENTLGSYIDALPEGEVEGADFSQVFDRGLANLTKYQIVLKQWDDDKKKYVVLHRQELDAAKDDGVSTDIIEAKINEYKNAEERVPLSLSPIDEIKQMLADAGYKCGEITGRKNALKQNDNGTVTKAPRKTDKKNEMNLFNNGGSDAIILNVAGATGISLHSSKRFKDQKPRTMIILQPAKNVNTEVQMRGRIDRTGQVHRGEYFYATSPIPAEQKLIMMLKQKLASLDANSVGTEDVSSNKVDSQDMDNKYGDEVARQFLIENMDVNKQLDNGLRWNRKTREWEGHEGLLYDVFIGIQRMNCETQQFVIEELTKRYAEQIEYLDQNGINDLKTTTMKLDATTIDEAVFVKGKDNESSNYFAHDTNIERVEANVLKKPLRSADIFKKMKKIGGLDEDGKIIDDYATTEIYEAITEASAQIIDEFEAKQEEKLKKFKEGLPAKLKWNTTNLTPEELEDKIAKAPSYIEFVNNQAAELSRKQSEINDMRSKVYHALMYLKQGMPYFVPLTDNVGNDAPMMYGRFIGFETGDYKPRSIKAVFAVKDSRSQISIPVITQKDAIDKIINDSRYEMMFQELMEDQNPNFWERRELTSDEKLKNVDEWWDKMIPKGETNRQIRYMITGNVLQACGAIGKYKGQIVSYTRLDKETGETTIDKGMLLAEDFDPENFRIKKKITKEDVWSNYSEHKDPDHYISVHRSGDYLVVKFNKRPNEKLSDHPIKKDEDLQKLFATLNPFKDKYEAWVEEEHVEEVLDQLYDKYSFTSEELFVMPDSTEKPDAIVRTDLPYKEVIDNFEGKYKCYGEYDCKNKLKKMLKQYKMDVNNEDLKNQIKEVSQLYQAYLREKYTKEENVHLAWQAIIYDEQAKQALASDDKDGRERAMRIREAILEELEYRKFGGHEMHLKQGEWDRKDFVDTFKKLNSNKDNEKRFDKIWDIVSKLDMNIILNEKINNSTGGQAAGKVVEYNWNYMNAKYISDQAKADTILHELTHTVTSYAVWCAKRGMEHLLTPDMAEDVNLLTSILNIIKNDPAFKHDGAEGTYPDYGTTNEHEILAEISSNESFRTDLKKVDLIMGTRFGKVSFSAYNPQNAGASGATKVNSYDVVMEILDRMIGSFNEKAWEEFYKGSQYGGYAYSRFEDEMRKEGKGEQAIKDAENPKAITILPGEPLSLFNKRVNEAFKGNQKLRKAHLDTAIERMKAEGDPDAEIKGAIGHVVFDRFEDKGIDTWFETQESAQNGSGEFQMVGKKGAKNHTPALDALLKAEKMEAEGKTPAEIRKETLCERGWDGKWRLEIPDFHTKLDNPPFSTIKEAAEYKGSDKFYKKFAEALTDANTAHAKNLDWGFKIGKLGDILGDDASLLLKMYPSLANIEVVARYYKENEVASIDINGKQLTLRNPIDVRENIIHEVQHEIQRLEEFTRGAHPDDFGNTETTRRADRIYSRMLDVLQGNEEGRESDQLYLQEIARTEGFKGEEELLDFVHDNSSYFKYSVVAGEVEARNVVDRIDKSDDWRKVNLSRTTEEFARTIQTASPHDGKRQFHLADSTVYGWSAQDGLHFTMEGLNPDTMIHEYGHAWLAAMKTANPALYESLMRLAKGTAAWDDVVNDPAYTELETDDEILSEVFARFSGTEGEKKLIDVTREAMNNGVDLKDKARLAAEYSRLAKKMDRAWGWTAKTLLGQDIEQFSSMAEAADMLLSDLVSNENGGGFTPSGRLKTSKNVSQYLPNKNQYSKGGNASAPSDVASYNYERIMETLGSRFEESWVDYLSSVRTLQESIIKETGNEMHDYENVYLHMMHLSSVNKAEQDKVQQTHVEPLIESMNELLKPIIQSYINSGMKKKVARERAMDELEKYMIAKHGLERNKVFARRDARAKAEKEFAERINQAEAELRKAKNDYASGLASKAEVDQKENDLNIIKAQQLIRENNLFAANRKVDYSGFTQTFGTKDMTNTELEKLAHDYETQFEARVGKSVTDDLWSKINAVNAYTLKKSLDSGNMSKDTYDTVSAQFKNYVPFRDWKETTAEDVYHYMGEGRDKVQPTLKRAKGRRSRAGDILSTMLAMNSSAIILGNKNKAKQKLLALIQNNKTSLTAISHTWYVQDTSGNWIPSYPPVDSAGRPTTDPQDIADWEQDMKDKQKQGLASVGHGHFDLDKPIKRWQENEHQIRVNRNGKEYVIYINGAPNAAQAINGQLNMDADNPNALEKITRLINPLMARAYTAWNPLFLVRNLQKDAISASMVGNIKFGPEYSARFGANLAKIMPGVAFATKATYNQSSAEDIVKRGSLGVYSLIRKYNQGSLDMNNEIEKYFQEFMENGGHTGYSMLWNVEEYDKKLNKAIKKANSKVLTQKADGVRESAILAVEEINAAFEDISRFATYMTSRQSGRSILMSVADAKDASTNFNKKGSGAMGNRLARDMYIFMNPAIQGVARYVYRLLGKDISGKGKDSDIRRRQTLRAVAGFTSLAAIGGLITIANYMLGCMNGDGDDDEIFGDSALGNDYWKLSTFKRRNTINIYAGSRDGYATFNLTPEEAVPYSIGAILVEHALGWGHADQIPYELTAQLSRLSPFGDINPDKWQTVGDAGAEMWRNILPSAFLPIWEVYDNRNFMGSQIHGYNNTLLKGTPKNQEAIHNAINSATNGRLGAIGNINNIDHILKGYFGGLVEFPMMLVNTVEGMISEEGVNLNETPAKVFWNSTSNKWNETTALRSEFDYYKMKVDYLDERLKAQGITKQKDQEQYVRQHLDDGIEYKYWDAFQKYAKDMNSRKGNIDKDDVKKRAIRDWRKIDE